MLLDPIPQSLELIPLDPLGGEGRGVPGASGGDADGGLSEGSEHLD